MGGHIGDESVGQWRPDMFVGDAIIPSIVFEGLEVLLPYITQKLPSGLT